jgi:pyruvate kinase
MSFATHTPPPTDTAGDLIRQLESLRREMRRQADSARPALQDLPVDRRRSAENLLHYLALRSRDLRPLQDRLTRLGLSSLGRAEPQVMATVDAVLRNLYLLTGREPQGGRRDPPYPSFESGADCARRNAASLLGPQPAKRRARILVTLPTEVADDYLMMHQLLRSGMDCIRINCSQDDAGVWLRMIRQLRDAERASGKACRILMDLGGPKLRTGPMVQVPDVVKIRPVRAADGQIVRPARIWLTPRESFQCEMSAADTAITLDANWLARLKVGDKIRLRDTRGSRRTWRVKEVSAQGCWAEARKTCYVANGTVLRLAPKKRGKGPASTISRLPAKDSVIVLRQGDALLVSSSADPGIPAVHDDDGQLLSPGRVSLAIPELFDDARRGDSVCFDDGRIAGLIEHIDAEQMQLRITHTRKPVEKLTTGKGINFPDTRISLPALGARDLKHLEFLARHADMVGLSFANRVEDVRQLRNHLRELGREDIGVVLKIETKQGFTNLPAMLLEALKFPACGVMIARGDLAVECGFQRLAEVQEEILWLCEAAHVPVIWATQVLEGLTKRGHASRAEITDAAMAQAAECVMLNKGPHIIKAVNALDDILMRMQRHHDKKRSMLRKLNLGQPDKKEPGPQA